MLKQILKFAFAFCVLQFMSSCVKDVDFEQADNLSVTPVLEASLIFFEEAAPRFSTTTSGENVTIIDSTDVTIFNDDFVVDNLTRAEFLFETTNSIDRTFTTEIEFLDENDELLYLVEFIVPASEDNEPQTTIHEEIFIDETLIDLKTTTQLVLSLTMQETPDDIPLDNDSIGLINIQSKGTFFINLIAPE